MSFVHVASDLERVPPNIPAIYSSSEDHSTRSDRQIPLQPPTITKGAWYYQELARHPVIYHETFVPRCNFATQGNLCQIPRGLTRIDQQPSHMIGTDRNTDTTAIGIDHQIAYNNFRQHAFYPHYNHEQHNSAMQFGLGLGGRPPWRMVCPVKSSSSILPEYSSQSSKPKLDPVIVPSDVQVENHSYHSGHSILESSLEDSERCNENMAVNSPIIAPPPKCRPYFYNKSAININTSKCIFKIDAHDSANYMEHDSGVDSMRNSNILREVEGYDDFSSRISHPATVADLHSLEEDDEDKLDIELDEKPRSVSTKALKVPADEESGVVDCSNSKISSTPLFLRTKAFENYKYAEAVSECSVIEHQANSDFCEHIDSSSEDDDHDLSFHNKCERGKTFVVPRTDINGINVENEHSYSSKNVPGYDQAENETSMCKPIRSSTPFENGPEILPDNELCTDEIAEKGATEEDGNHSDNNSVFENEDEIEDDQISSTSKDDLCERGLEETEIILLCDQNDNEDTDHSDTSDSSHDSLKNVVVLSETGSNCNAETEKLDGNNAIECLTSSNQQEDHTVDLKNRSATTKIETKDSAHENENKLSVCDNQLEKDCINRKTRSCNQGKTCNIILLPSANATTSDDQSTSSNTVQCAVVNKEIPKAVTNPWSPWQPWARKIQNVGEINACIAQNSQRNDILKIGTPNSVIHVNTNTFKKDREPEDLCLENVNMESNSKDILHNSNIIVNENKTFYTSIYQELQGKSDHTSRTITQNTNEKELPVLSNSLLEGISSFNNGSIEPTHSGRNSNNCIVGPQFVSEGLTPYVVQNQRKRFPSLETRISQRQTCISIDKNAILIDKSCQQHASGNSRNLPPLAMFKRATPSELHMWSVLNPIEGCNEQNNLTMNEATASVGESKVQERNTSVYSETIVENKVTVQKVYKSDTLHLKNKTSEYVSTGNLQHALSVHTKEVQNSDNSPDSNVHIDVYQEQQIKKNTKSLNPLAVYYMSEWFDKHQSYPYPTTSEKRFFAKVGNISLAQVSSWFANKRARMIVRGKKQSPLLVYPKSASPNIQTSNSAVKCGSSPVFAMPHIYRAVSGKENDNYCRENLMKESLLRNSNMNKHKRGLSDVSNIQGGWNSSPEIDHHFRASKKQRITSE